MESDKIIDKLRRYVEEKEGLDLQSEYFVLKQALEEVWQDILAEGDDVVEDQDDDFADFDGEDDSEEGLGEQDVDDIDEEPIKKAPIKNQVVKKDNSTIIKKPKIKLVP
jgi:hypothetical protein